MLEDHALQNIRYIFTFINSRFQMFVYLAPFNDIKDWHTIEKFCKGKTYNSIGFIFQTINLDTMLEYTIHF